MSLFDYKHLVVFVIRKKYCCRGETHLTNCLDLEIKAIEDFKKVFRIPGYHHGKATTIVNGM